MVLNVGVIGTGNIGSDHVRRLATQVSGARVAALFDVDGERAGAVADRVGARVHSQAADVIEDIQVDAVVIASPGDTHADLVLACVAADKPVLCEKPLATTVESALKVLEAEVAHGRRLTRVGFMRRHDPGYRAVKVAVDDGSVGEPLLMHCVHRNASVPAGFTSDMSLTDSVIHEIDAARWLLGDEIVAATVVAVRPSPLATNGMRDPQLVLLETAGGAVVDVEVFLHCQYGYDVRCEVVGANGTVSLDTPTTGALTRSGRREQAVPEDWRVRFAPAYLDELQQWVDGVASGNGGGGGSSAWDGYAATAVAQACVASLSSGARTAVGLVDRPTLYA
ncbi:Gfo/Idh/MocA family oxidoreductase [Planosporangium mesophilum]|uniref:Inositol 2-dehydrogenase n=1 Tax=Planosporangium mesophilum TaxID=689768 RepID=A0A8J3X1C7_9ACTN|nr:Gfo/Idh/MocA family oxidoreductase [Planosporangium mesophilum]NJC82854.1 Gfo/Idh/MocA family oxidoreductase [Planosporangium mesophilum]GII23676.1 inositol 2-dehydrogenase [Planosporangium mesophilum]